MNQKQYWSEGDLPARHCQDHRKISTLEARRRPRTVGETVSGRGRHRERILGGPQRPLISRSHGSAATFTAGAGGTELFHRWRRTATQGLAPGFRALGQGRPGQYGERGWARSALSLSPFSGGGFPAASFIRLSSPIAAKDIFFF